MGLLNTRCLIVKARGGKGPVRFVLGCTGRLRGKGGLLLFERTLGLSPWNDVGSAREAVAARNKRRVGGMYISKGSVAGYQFLGKHLHLRLEAYGYFSTSC